MWRYKSKGHWGNGDYRIWTNEVNDKDYILHLIKDSYKKINLKNSL